MLTHFLLSSLTRFFFVYMESVCHYLEILFLNTDYTEFISNIELNLPDVQRHFVVWCVDARRKRGKPHAERD